MKAGSVKKTVCSLTAVALCLLFAEQTILHVHAWENFTVSSQDDDRDDYDDFYEDVDDYDDYDDYYEGVDDYDFDDYFDDDYDDYFEGWYFDSGQSSAVYYYNVPEISVPQGTVTQAPVQEPLQVQVQTPIPIQVQTPTQVQTPLQEQSPSQVQTPAPDKATAVLNAVNAARAQYGLSPLAHDGDLQSCAAIRANEIVANFSHTRPDGSAWYSLNPGIMFGENLLMTSGSPDADAIVNQWMQSPGHRALILDASFGRAAAAGASGNGSEYWVLEFGY